jgi:formylmethanofuran dehydrogenase subunit D
MSDIISLEGPLELMDGELVVCIPLNAGGDKFVALTKQIGRVVGENLVIVIKPWLAEKLSVSEGSLVVVDNRYGKFNITRSAANDSPQPPSALH